MPSRVRISSSTPQPSEEGSEGDDGGDGDYGDGGNVEWGGPKGRFINIFWGTPKNQRYTYSVGHWSATCTSVLWGFMRLDMW